MGQPNKMSPASKVLASEANGIQSSYEMLTNSAVTNDPEEGTVVLHAIDKIGGYLMDNSPVFRELETIRAKVSLISAQETLSSTVYRWTSRFSDHE